MMDDRLRVLVVDDEDMVRATLVDMLGLAGYEVCGEAVDGIQALEAVGRLHPDIVMMDICMPRMDGIQAARVIRSTWNIPIIFLTAFLDREMVNRAADAGAFAYLIKPCRQAELAPAIEMALKRFGETRSHHERARQANGSCRPCGRWQRRSRAAQVSARCCSLRCATSSVAWTCPPPRSWCEREATSDLDRRGLMCSVGNSSAARWKTRSSDGRCSATTSDGGCCGGGPSRASGNAFGPCRSALAVPVPVGAAPPAAWLPAGRIPLLSPERRWHWSARWPARWESRYRLCSGNRQRGGRKRSGASQPPPGDATECPARCSGDRGAGPRATGPGEQRREPGRSPLLPG